MKQPALFFAILFFPFLFIGCFLYLIAQSMDNSTEKINVGIVDEDQTFETKTLANQLQNEDSLSNVLHMFALQKEQAIEELDNSRLTAVIYIPEGFTSDLRSGENTPITVRTNNENLFSSNMVKMLLNSGAKYISAAQSGINTLYDLYIKHLPSDENPQRVLQQMIVNYTLFALNRNDLFEMEQVESGAKAGWEYHGVIAYLLTSLLMSALLLQIFTHREEEAGIEERLRTFNIPSFTIVWSELMFYTVFLYVNAGFLNLLIYVVVDSEWLLHGYHFITWFFICLILAIVLCILEWFLPNQTTRTNIYLLLTLLGLFISGVWIPVLYLPVWIKHVLFFSPFHHMYQAFVTIISDDENPFRHWIFLTALVLILAAVLLTKIVRRERKDGYVSFSFK